MCPKSTSMVTGANDEIFLGGYVADDSLRNHYKLMVININGKKLWQRVYTSEGEINNITATSQDNLVLAGSKWAFKMSPKGYILWEKPFDVNDSITTLTVLADESCIFAGNRDSTKLFITKVTGAGAVSWTKEIQNENGFTVTKCFALPDGKFLMNCKSEVENIVHVFNNEGILLKSMPVPEGSGLFDFAVDIQGNLLLQFNSADNILVLKNSGFIF
ncbi:MAG: hypothetical protein HC906_07565 [Bacteroidales bacterium]|nr:hypothetical protein [Bacteroidales bacterium]